MGNPKHDILRRVRIFAALSDAECDALLLVLKARRGGPGDALFKQGDPGGSLMVVLDGHLTARVRTAGGIDEEVGTFGPGEVVGEMAFIDAEPRSATVSSPGVATVLEFTREGLAQLRREAPRVAASIMKEVLVDVAHRLREIGEKERGGSGRATFTGAPVSVPGVGPDSMRRSGRGVTVEQLRAYAALKPYATEDLELLAYMAALRPFAAGEALMTEGTPGDTCYLLLSGEVDVTRASVATAVATLKPGALVGQLALIDRAPRSATVTATKDTMALELRADTFANLVQGSTPLATRFQDQVALAGVRQLRAATVRYAQIVDSRAASGGEYGMGKLDDWDDPPESHIVIELAIDPKSIRR